MAKLFLFLLVTQLVPCHAADPTVFFETRVRPVLTKHCYACHTSKMLGGLRVDSRAALLEGGAHGPAIQPGKSDQSLLVEAISQTNDKLKMPLGGKLADQEIADIKSWIDMGAAWPEETVATARTLPGRKQLTAEQLDFWSFRPLQTPAPPAVRDSAWVKNPIDRFVLAQFESKGLRPVGPAPKQALIRRATFDLTGLPPTPEEVHTFMNDSSPQAFEKVIDRLLASPAYGERWGRHWLDVVRYADSEGSGLGGDGKRNYPNAYRYRDWVVDAFNRDLPYDRFLKSQLAADLMPDVDKDSLLPALGFFGMAPWHNSAEPDMLADERDDRIDVVTRGFLGLTVACARCHDHKYDPIATEYYYGLAGVFANIEYHEYNLVPEAQVKAYQEQDAEYTRLERERNAFLADQTRQLSEILANKTARYMEAAWPVLRGEQTNVDQLATERGLDRETLGRWITYLSQTERSHPYLKNWDELVKGGGTTEKMKRAAESFQLIVLEMLAERRANDAENRVILATHKPRDDARRYHFPNGVEAIEGFDGGPFPAGLAIKALQRDKYILWRELFESTRGQFDYVDQDAAVLEYRERTVTRFLAPEWKDYLAILDANLENLNQSRPKKYPFLMGIQEYDRPSNVRVHIRGSALNLGDEVPRSFPAVLTGGKRIPFTTGSGRLELANAVAAHPLTARVMANRIWLNHFGSGLVDTPSNFGQLGERPSNPDLLEHLASTFKDSGWSVKKLHKYIMLSATYQLAAQDSAADSAVDPANRLYWRANRRRLEVEALRDSALFVAGALDPRVGGPSQELTDQNRRRTLYGQISRARIEPLLALFDFPDPGLTCEKRNSTSIPSQRLFFLNSDLIAAQADALVKRLKGDSPDAEARVREVYWLLFGRDVRQQEVALAEKFLAQAGDGGWKEYVRALMSTDEFYFVN